MNKVFILIILLTYFNFRLAAQENNKELQKLSAPELFNLQDSTCINLTGEWTGEEVQYDATQSFIKVKFKVVFELKQEGNRVYGTSYIEDKFRGSYGDMKIRGLVRGNVLHFEEYEIVNEKFFEKGVVWCLRSGEMKINVKGNKIVMEGLSYNGYASDNYSLCTDYAKMSVTRTIDLIKPLGKQAVSASQEKNREEIQVRIFPNPCVDQTTISYQFKNDCNVQIDVFSLSGALIEQIKIAGPESRETTCNMSSYAAGVYLVRVRAGNLYTTKQLVKTN